MRGSISSIYARAKAHRVRRAGAGEPQDHPEVLVFLRDGPSLRSAPRGSPRRRVLLRGGGVGALERGYGAANHHHFAIAKEATVVSVTAMGPFAMTYVNPADDPTKTAQH